MSFEINSFEDYLKTVRDELPSKRHYFRGQKKTIADGYALKPSLGRYDRLKKINAIERTKREREVLEVFSNHLLRRSEKQLMKERIYLSPTLQAV